MEASQELIAQAEEMARSLQAEVASLVSEFNQKIKEAGERAGVSLVTDIEIQIVKKDEEQG